MKCLTEREGNPSRGGNPRSGLAAGSSCLISHVAGVHLFLLPTIILLYGCTTYYCSPVVLMNIWVVSILGPLMNDAIYTSLREHIFLGGHLVLKFLGYIVSIWLNFSKIVNFPKFGCIILYFHQHSMKIPVSTHTYQHLALLIFGIIATVVRVDWYHVVVLICISITANQNHQLFLCLLVICISLR